MPFEAEVQRELAELRDIHELNDALHILRGNNFNLCEQIIILFMARLQRVSQFNHILGKDQLSTLRFPLE